ncbi:hypothetical protein [Pseudomonas sp. CGJS7]|uniref:hypothetical protein n=1 Tax=Pseudomonas sp. CGJS7 TaxID=3109348 RepID=UPI0030096D6F
MTSPDISSKLVEAASAAGWKSEDVKILDNHALDRNQCKFFRAVHKRRMDGATLELATLPDGRVVGGDPSQGDSSAAASILSQCGNDSPAEWWAEVVARFSGKAAGRVVKSERDAYDIGEIEKRGGHFAPPVLERSGDATHLQFFGIQYEPNRPFKVSATLSKHGDLVVTSEPLGAN